MERELTSQAGEVQAQVQAHAQVQAQVPLAHPPPVKIRSLVFLIFKNFFFSFKKKKKKQKKEQNIRNVCDLI